MREDDLHQADVRSKIDPEGTEPVSTGPASPDPEREGPVEPDRRARRTTLDDVMRREAEEIGRRRRRYRVGRPGPEPTARGRRDGMGLTGLSMSGGGIRSACFNLGILEGLDRRPAVEAGADGPNCLECFDYISSVSGGSYAAGHLATAMLAPTPGPRPQAEWLGKVQLTSKTVPGWIWGLGVWFLGVVFQLLKTGSLLVAALAFAALMIRILDAPDAANFSTAMGLSSDVARGFVPFWLTLWAFLVGYCINSSIRHGGRWANLWFGYFAILTIGYASAVWFFYSVDTPEPYGLSFGVQYAFLAALFAPPAAACAAVILWRSVVTMDSPLHRRCRRIWGKVQVKSRRVVARRIGPAIRMLRRGRFMRWMWPESAEPPDAGESGCGARAVVDGPTLKTSLLAPILVALFCFAALVTTGDVSLGDAVEESSKAASLQERSQWYGELGDRIYYFACGALALISMGFMFPHDLFKSARRVEAFDAASGGKTAGRAPRRGWEPVFRVVVFLCSYGFVLLLVFVAFSTVARENVSGYYNWRSDLPSAAFHVTDLREADPAWERIERDSQADSHGSWKKLAERFSRAREIADFPLGVDRERAAEIRLLDSRPWIDRALWPIAWIWRLSPWPSPLEKDGYRFRPTAAVHYQMLADQSRDQRRLSEAISETVLSDPVLYTIIPSKGREPDPADRPSNWDPKRYAGLGERYRERAMSLAAMRFPGSSLPGLDPAVSEIPAGRDGGAVGGGLGRPPQDVQVSEIPAGAERGAGGRAVAPAGRIEGGPGLVAAIRNNNRRALHLYLPGLLRDRRDALVFASIVWREDQWTRFRIGLVAAVVWILCCVVDVNTYALQKFYRGHVIDSWVKIEPGKVSPRWLHQTHSGYRGWEFGPPTPGEGGRRERSSGRRERRAPLLLINATLEGNRSLGDEPELPSHIFTFSPVASGSGTSDYWATELKDGKKSEEFARRNRLDIGNIVAISGAFLSPGTIANPALSAVLHLLNIQTGYWVRKPDEFRRRKLSESVLFHLCQSIGIDREDDSRLMLTDGAHVENLGLYALLRRRCRLVVVSDCSQEDAGAREDRRFDSLIQAIQQAAVDGVEIGPFLSSRAYRYWLETGKIPDEDPERTACLRRRSTGLNLVRAVKPPTPVASGWEAALGRILNFLRPQRPGGPGRDGDAAPSPADLSPAGRDEAGAGLVFAQEHYVFARILYPDKTRGLLVYLRPTLTGDEGDTLLHGAAHTQFPDDDPVDQFYTPAKMSTYRLLGRHIADELMDDEVMEDVIRAFLDGRDIAPAPGRKNKLEDFLRCHRDCGADGKSCASRLQRSVRMELRLSHDACRLRDGVGGVEVHLNGHQEADGPT